MITKVLFKFGPTGFSDKLSIEPSAMTVFIGANNTGKSLALRELATYCEEGRREAQKIIDTVEVSLPTPASARLVLERFEVPVGKNETLAEGHIRVARLVPAVDRPTRENINWKTFEQYLLRLQGLRNEGTLDWKVEETTLLYRWYVSQLTLVLDGERRLSLVDEREAGDLSGKPANQLAALFIDDDARSRLRDIVHEAFGLYFVVDPTSVGKLRVRLSEIPPADPRDEQGLDSHARTFHAQASEIHAFSDGVKAFCGIMAAMMSSEYQIILVDEPDAFLHPTLGRKLGKEMVRLASERGGNVFASTHSSAFLMGCMESGKPVNVVRLTYDSPNATARLLSADSVRGVMREPLLRSTKVLEALFSRGAVVVESDPDRALYEEINNRLELCSDRHVRDSVFLNAHNKQTVHKIVELLRRIGIPAAAVVDFDILKERDLLSLMKACQVPDGVARGVSQMKADVLATLESGSPGWEQTGVESLDGHVKETCREMLALLCQYGIFVVPVGNRESWLASIGVTSTKNKSYWLERTFELLGADPDDPSYIRPGKGDVWEFVRAIAKWVSTSERKGMPTS